MWKNKGKRTENVRWNWLRKGVREQRWKEMVCVKKGKRRGEKIFLLSVGLVNFWVIVFCKMWFKIPLESVGYCYVWDSVSHCVV